eukprot:TRINITY_DN5655_c0_g1_i1.p1 TRINITY_DN5655_c0_g1~~TRINITY_DN5655_c0_g1_i1.p1  ORF type:complete len:570 (-),score=146.97 TRINITY_DN5655_c0_g1_i1:37-1746(-)
MGLAASDNNVNKQTTQKQNNYDRDLLMKFTEKEIVVLKQIFEKIRLNGKEQSTIHNQNNKTQYITEEEFTKYFNMGYIPEMMIKKIYSRWIKGEYIDKEDQNNKDKLNFYNFADGMSNCCKNSNFSGYLDFYLSIFFEDRAIDITREQIVEVFESSALLFFYSFQKKEKKADEKINPLNEEERGYIGKMVDYFFGDRHREVQNEPVSLREIKRWIEQKTPQLGSCLPYIIYSICCVEESERDLDMEDSLFSSDILNRIYEFAISIATPTPSYSPNYNNCIEIKFSEKEVIKETNETPSELTSESVLKQTNYLFDNEEDEQTLERARKLLAYKLNKFSYKNWTSLFSTNRNGYSINRFEHNVFCYEHPTLLLIRTKDQNILGAYCVEEWKCHNNFYGEESSKSKNKLHRKGSYFLFSISPSFKILSAKGPNKNFMYYYKAALSKTSISSSSLDQGIGFGGQLGHFRMSIDKDLSKITVHTYDSTYEEGDLIGNKKDEVIQDIDVIEVIGVGESDALEKQSQSQKRDEKITMQRRKVNKDMMFGTDQRKIEMNILEMGGAHKSYVIEADHN